MPSSKRIAIVIDLEWTLKHHHGVFAGAERYAREQDWEYTVWSHYPGDLGTGRPSKGYDGIVGRVTTDLAAGRKIG